MQTLKEKSISFFANKYTQLRTNPLKVSTFLAKTGFTYSVFNALNSEELFQSPYRSHRSFAYGVMTLLILEISKEILDERLDALEKIFDERSVYWRFQTLQILHENLPECILPIVSAYMSRDEAKMEAIANEIAEDFSHINLGM